MDDDDFEDFGGFEAAEPIPPSEAEPVPIGLQAGPSPWALFQGTATGSPQPVETEAAPKPQLSPPAKQSAETKAAPAVQSGSQHQQAPPAPAGLPAAVTPVVSQTETLTDITKSLDSKKTTMSSTPVNHQTDSHTSKGGGESGKESVQNPFLTSKGQDKNTTSALSFDTDFENMFPTDSKPTGAVSVSAAKLSREVKHNDPEVKSTLDTEGSADSRSLSSCGSGVNPSESGISLGSDLDDAVSKEKTPSPAKEMVTKEIVTKEMVTKAEPKVTDRIGSPVKLKKLEEKVSDSEKEKSKLEKELKEIMERNKSLELELDSSVRKLEDQMKKYEKMQSKHREELEEIRKSSNSALSIIVEEYKELVKTAVQQQQEACDKQVRDALIEERTKQQQVVKEQKEAFEKMLEDEKSRWQKQLKELVAQQTEIQEKAVTEAVKEERTKVAEEVKKALETERATNEKLVAKCIEGEQEKASQLLQEEKIRNQKDREDDMKKFKLELTTALEEERQQSQVLLKDTLTKEQKKNRDLVAQAVQEAKNEMLTYLQEKKQDDLAVRRKSLASVELFLEGAKKQIQLLLEDDGDKQTDVLGS